MTALLWDVQLEYLTEAEFTFEAWERSLDSPSFTLREVHEGPEARLRAYIRGLLVGGEPVLQRLVLPIFDAPDEDRFKTAAATLAAASSPNLDARAHALETMARAGKEGLWGLVRGFQHTNRKGIGRLLATGLAECEGSALAGRLEALAPRGLDPKKRLVAWLGDGDAQVRRSAAMLARNTASAAAMRALNELVRDDSEPEVQLEAIETALVRGLPGSWQVASGLALGAKAGDAHRRRALAWLALQGDAEAHATLIAEVRKAPDADGLWAVGLTGRPAAVELAVELLDDKRLARVAGEVLAFVAGLPLDDKRWWLDDGARGLVGADPEEALPPLAKDDLDANLVPPVELELHGPNPKIIRRWWSGQRERLEADGRYLCGRPLDGRRLLWGLRELPTRRRHPLALELALRSHGKHGVDTRAAARTQLATQAKLGPLREALAAIDCQSGLPLL